MMEDKILIVDHTIEEITVEEFTGAPTGTIITTTHGMDKGDQHTIRDIVGLTTKLDNIEMLKPVRSNLGGHADYYQWGEEATEDNPLGPGYFVRLGTDGMIHKCTNETVVLRPTDLSLNKDENGEVIIYALAGNIPQTAADINKYYVVGTEAPYDIYGYDGIEYVQKSAYSYDGEQVIRTCHTTDMLGVTVSSAGFVGNDENITETYTSAKAADPSRYALVATTGVVDVLCDHSILVGDYVFPTVSGWAAKSTGSYGYLVTALVQNGIVVQTVDAEELLYARIVLSQSMVNAKKVSDNVDYLLAETKRIGENVIQAVNVAQTALDEARDNSNSLSDRVNNFESSMGAMSEQLYTNTVAVDNANTTAAHAEEIARQAETFVQEVADSATGGASEALAIVKNLEGEMEALSADMDAYSSKVDIIESEQSTQATMISKANDDIAAVQTKATNLENNVITLANKDTELANTMSLIDQKANEQGASITALTSKIDKYSVGEYSQAYGLTQAQAADILEAGKIVFIPTDFVSSDASFTEIYNPITVETWVTTDKNTKYIYSDSTYYYYHNGSQWVSTSISDGQTAGYCVTRFAEGWSYVWNGLKWQPETPSQNVFFTDDAPAGMGSVSPLYWVVGAGYKGTDYKVGALYLYNNNVWSEVALGTSNSMSRTVALVTQTQNSWQEAINNVNGDMAALSAKVDENGSNVAMVASVVKEVTGVNLDFADNTEKTPYTSKDDIISTDKTKYFVVGDKAPYDIYYYDGTQYVQKINWSYDGQRVLQPNTASIVTSANEDTSGILLGASHIKFEGENYTVNAGNIDFTGDDYKINADRIELAGSTTFSNYAQLEDVIKEQKVEYTKSTSNITLEGEIVWGTDYPIRDSGEYIWRKTTVIKGDDTELTPIIECITPADGKDGTSVAIKGTADSIIQQGDLWQITYDGSIVVNAALGDGYMYDGDLYVCVQVIDGVDLFSNVGQIQGPQGTSGASLQIIYKAQDTAPETPTGTNPIGWSPTMPTSGVIYMSQKLSNATVWSSPVRISGEKGEPGSDGVGAKYVYYLIPEDGTLPTKPIFENGALVTTTGWTEKPSGVNERRQYEYVSVSTETEKVGDNESIQNWINFSEPVVWSKWGEKGQDGDGVEYLYCLQADNTNPPTITINYGDEPISPWTDEPTGTSEDNPYEYVVQIKSTDIKGSTYTGKLWGVYDGMMALYCASIGAPITPTGKGSVASTSENTTWNTNIPPITDSQSVWVSYKTFLGTNWSTPVKVSAKDGASGKAVKSVETYYLVTKTDTLSTEESTEIGKWNTSIENWGTKDGNDIYQYLWIREKMTMDDNVTVIWTDPRLDASMTTIGNWCAEKDKTVINGGNIATGSITAAQMAADSIKSQNYNGTIDDNGTITAYGTVGTMLNLKDGILDSNNIRITGHVTATSGEIGGCEIVDGQLTVDKVSTLSANLGEITAGSIESNEYSDGADIRVWEEEELTPSEGLAYTLSTDGTYYSVSLGDCTDINIVIPSSYENLPVKAIDGMWGGLFSAGAHVLSIKIPNSVTTIGDYAFDSCRSLKTINLPSSVTSLGVAVFQACSSLESIAIPYGITSIGGAMFNGCSSLMSIVIPSSVTSIAKTAFTNCSSLTSIEIPASVTSIGNNAFQYCNALKSITFGKDSQLLTIAQRMFDGCSSLTSIVIPDSVKWIYAYAFAHCSNLTSVVIGGNIISIGKDAFRECGSLSMYYKGTTSQWSTITINDTSTSFTSATIYYYSETEPESEGNYWHYKDAEGFKISCDDEYMINSPYFKVTQDGKIEATDAYLSGEIEANDGKIGGWDLERYETEDGVSTLLSNEYLILQTMETSGLHGNNLSTIQLNGVYNNYVTLSHTDDDGVVNTYSFYTEKSCPDCDNVGDFLKWLFPHIPQVDDQYQYLMSDICTLTTPIIYEDTIYRYGILLYETLWEDYELIFCTNPSLSEAVHIDWFVDEDQITVSNDKNMQINTIIRDTGIQTREITAQRGIISTLFVDRITGSEAGGSLIFSNKPSEDPNKCIYATLTIEHTSNNYVPKINFYQDDKLSTPYTLTSAHTITIYYKYEVWGVWTEASQDILVPKSCSSYLCSSIAILDRYNVDFGFRKDYVKQYNFWEYDSAYAPRISISTNFMPTKSGEHLLGGESNRWKEIWCTQSSLNSTSDRNEKNSIEQLSDQYDVFFDALQPVRYKFNQNESNRYHVGFISQDVHEALNLANIPTSDFAGYLAYDKEDGTTGYGLRYSEFIALNTYEIQKLKKEITELKKQVEELKATQQND